MIKLLNKLFNKKTPLMQQEVISKEQVKKNFIDKIDKYFDLKTSESLEYDPIHRIPKWVVKMCEKLTEDISHVRGDNTITLEQVLRADRMAAGHSDYSSKLALYCAELSM